MSREVFAGRLTELMTLVKADAFQRLDQRLAAALLGHGAVAHATHQALADQLGSAREIVTRLLKRFELAGLVSRERIEVVDVPALRVTAQIDPPRGAIDPTQGAGDRGQRR